VVPSNGVFMSRIDRVLVSKELLNYWGNGLLWVLARDVLNHFPLVLKGGGWDQGRNRSASIIIG